jgi:hypothetical protein
MRKSGLGVVRQRGIGLFYDGVGFVDYTADLIVEDQGMVQRKASGKPLYLLVNFGRSKVEIRRITVQA